MQQQEELRCVSEQLQMAQFNQVGPLGAGGMRISVPHQSVQLSPSEQVEVSDRAHLQ